MLALSEKVTEAREVQPSKAPVEIALTVLGMAMEVRLVQFLKS